MASEKTLVKRYINQAGLDLKSNDLTRQERFASAMLNAQYKKSGTIEKRPGFQAHANNGGEYGLFYYSKIDPVTGEEQPEALSVSDTVEKLQFTTLTITYSGTEAVAYFSLYFDTTANEYKCKIIEGTDEVLNESLGIGFDEASTVTCNTLKSAIDALPTFACTLTGATSTPAAFLENQNSVDISTTDLSISAGYWTAVNSPLASMLSGSGTNKNAVDFENPSFVQINNVAYVANGYDNLLKYDGQTLYRAGLPKPNPISATLGAGSITGGPYTYRTNYVQWDAAGNLVESDPSLESPEYTLAAQNATLALRNIEADTGFNTGCAIVAGTQASTAIINVDDGAGGAHTLQVGDTAYFYDTISLSYVERLITARTNSTITIDGAAVGVTDNSVISNNLRIGIYRNATSLAGIVSWYFVAEVPNNSFAATQNYVDSTTDANLGFQLVEPLFDRGLPPKGKYITSFRNQMIIGGKIDEQNTVFYSDIESPEYFPVLNRFDVNTVAGDKVTGVAPNNEVLAIFKDKSIFVLSGNLAENTFRVDQITNDIGCIAHHSIKEVRGMLFFLSDVGPRKMVGGQIPVALGESVDNALVSRIDPIFEQINVSADELWVLKRACAVNDRMKEKYLLFIPCETVHVGDKSANSFSKVYAYDYSRDAWLEWNNMNMASGVIETGDDLYWLEKQYSTYSTSTRNVLYRRHKTDTEYDYQDNDQPIDFFYSSQWETLGEPSVMKKFLNVRVFSVDDSTHQTNLTVTTEHNFIEGDTKSSFDMIFGGGGYGISSYGNNPYGDPTEGAKKHKINSSRTRSLRVKFANDLDQENVIITGWELEVAAPFARVMKS